MELADEGLEGAGQLALPLLLAGLKPLELQLLLLSLPLPLPPPTDQKPLLDTEWLRCWLGVGARLWAVGA